MIQVLFSPNNNKILSINMTHDVMSFMQELRRCSGSYDFQLIPNTFNIACEDSSEMRLIVESSEEDVLLSKIRAVLKRNHEMQEKQHAVVEFNIGAYQFNSKLRTLKLGEESHTLSPKENELLLMLCEYKNDLLPRELALKRIWGSDTYFNGRSMDVYIAKLRKYLREDSSVEIVNIHGNGFRLVVPE
jgi:DNA-binding response OmpR family regulator